MSVQSSGRQGFANAFRNLQGVQTCPGEFQLMRLLVPSLTFLTIGPSIATIQSLDYKIGHMSWTDWA